MLVQPFPEPAGMAPRQHRKARLAIKEGCWLLLLISFIALPIRGVIAAEAIGNGAFIRCSYLTGSARDCRA